ncbi:MAG: alkaline phosphatase family protein [Planctomycetaceae bacterium]|nr:alkaline phosphatase family protein [Planctomycetaceae bacterium]
MMRNIVFLSIPALREKDLAKLPALNRIMSKGAQAQLTPSFPCVTCPVQANLTTGLLPNKHGITGNGIWTPDTQKLTMWTFTNEAVQQAQLWDLIYHHPDSPRSAVWFPLQAVECEAEFVCTHKPIHHPDGTEELWCYTRWPTLYRDLMKEFGHFPLQNYWGPMANVTSANWVVNTASWFAGQESPEFFYIYLAYPDYAPQRFGVDSPEVDRMLGELNTLLDTLITKFEAAYDAPITWFIAGEYAMTDVDHTLFPNRMLREAGLLKVKKGDGVTPSPIRSVTRDYEKFVGELPDMAESKAFAYCDHQFAHIYIPDHDSDTIRKVAQLFEGKEGVAEVLVGADIEKYGLNHERSGDVILMSTPNSWMAYFWWLDDADAPDFARRVDIHQKPGYDPCEQFIDFATRSIPLDVTRVKASHGAAARDRSQKTVFLCSDAVCLPVKEVRDVDVFHLIMDSTWRK